MQLSREQETVLDRISQLSSGKTTVPVTLGALHGTFSDMDVRDLVRHLEVLFRDGLIGNADHSTGLLGNRYVLTPEGAACSGTPREGRS